MNQYKDSRKYVPYIARDGSHDGHGKIHKALTAVPKLCLSSALVVTAVAVVTLATGDWGVRSALAKTQTASQKDSGENASLPVTLSVTGPDKAIVGEPLQGITVRLLNTGLALRDSRLRMTIHDDQGHDYAPDDIKIEVKEGNAWKPVPVVTIDEGAIAAIGAAGDAHTEIHQSGGFAIGDNAKMAWQLRVTFNVPGNYVMVLSVTPDNGQTQLAQPLIVNLEAS